ncbi:hypothetical protein HBI32_118090 [Parastagonospora nodorum]|nr:hypothetical protein HBI32_118090 [Parastagonospora nodorum]
MGKLLSPLKNAAKSGILLVCADRRIRQCYLTICAILRCLNKGHDDFVHLVNCFGWKHYNFNIYVSLVTDTLHLLLKGLVIKMLDFITTLLVAVISLLFILKAPFALHFIRAVCNLRTLEEEKNFNYPKWYALTHIIQDIRMYGALDSICTGANSKAHYITMLIPGIQPYLTKLLLSEVAVNIAISDFIYAAAVFDCLDIDLSWSSSKRHNDSKHCDEEVLYLILIIIDYTCYDKDRKYIAYIGAFSEVLLVRRRAWNAASKRWILQAFKFYDLSMIICLVHLVLRDLPNLITHTTMSYYVNNYID